MLKHTFKILHPDGTIEPIEVLQVTENEHGWKRHIFTKPITVTPDLDIIHTVEEVPDIGLVGDKFERVIIDDFSALERRIWETMDEMYPKDAAKIQPLPTIERPYGKAYRRKKGRL